MNSSKCFVACSIMLIFLLKHIKIINALPHNSSTTPSATQTASSNNLMPLVSRIFNKTICTFHMDLYDAESITCPTGYKFSILNAYIFDMGNASCLSSSSFISSQSDLQTILPLEYIRNKIQSLCRNEAICYIFKYYLTSLYEPYKRMNNLAANIFWNCYKVRKEGIKNYKRLNIKRKLWIFFINLINIFRLP